MSDKDDGVALTATRHPPLITDEMIQAGQRVMASCIYGDSKSMLTAVYAAMCDAAPALPDEDDWPPDESIETAGIEIKE